MSSFNRVILMGNLTRAPECKALASGTSVCEFGLAVNDRYKDKAGEWVDRPTFVDVTMWGPRAEAFAKYHTKGRATLIEGRLQLRLKVIAESFEFVGGKDKAAGNVEPKPQGGSYGHDDDIPF